MSTPPDAPLSRPRSPADEAQERQEDAIETAVREYLRSPFAGECGAAPTLDDLLARIAQSPRRLHVLACAIYLALDDANLARNVRTLARQVAAEDERARFWPNAEEERPEDKAPRFYPVSGGLD